jgi:hypothetical protein
VSDEATGFLMHYDQAAGSLLHVLRNFTRLYNDVESCAVRELLNKVRNPDSNCVKFTDGKMTTSKN